MSIKNPAHPGAGIQDDLDELGLKENAASTVAPPPTWIAKPMGSRVNLSDKEAVYRALDR